MSKMEFWKAGGGSSMPRGWLGSHMFVWGVRWGRGVGRAEGEVSRGDAPPSRQEVV